MTRVIAGELGGRTLDTPRGRATRPTSDRVREALFSSLSEVVARAHVLDLFAGSGALAIEAVSRGASAAVLVDSDRRAVAIARQNLQRLGIGPDRATVYEMTAESFCTKAPATPPRQPFDIVLVDPPYAVGMPALLELLSRLHRAGRLAAGATVVVERDKRDAGLDAALPPFLVADRRRTYGDTVLVYLRVDEEPLP